MSDYKCTLGPFCKCGSLDHYCDFPGFGRPLFKYMDQYDYGDKREYIDCILLVPFGRHPVNTRIDRILCRNVYELDSLEFKSPECGEWLWYDLVKKNVEVGDEHDADGKIVLY
jgi:hypothetical protein